MTIDEISDPDIHNNTMNKEIVLSTYHATIPEGWNIESNE